MSPSDESNNSWNEIEFGSVCVSVDDAIVVRKKLYGAACWSFSATVGAGIDAVSQGDCVDDMVS